MRRRWRASAAERAAARLETTTDTGGWRARSRPTGKGARDGGSWSWIAASAIDPALLTSAGPSAELLVEPAALVPGYLDPDTGRPLLSAELQPVCRALAAQACAPGARRRKRLILVTSPASGEGKTFMAVNLALALSQGEGRPVLLIDGDAQSAGAARALGWQPQPGLTEALGSEATPDGLIGTSGLERLSFVPPGRPAAATAELLAGRRAARLMRELLTSAPDGLVIIDGPPLLAGLVGPALAAHAGQVVLVVAAGRTSRQAIDDSLARLGERAKVGCVLARPAAPARRIGQGWLNRLLPGVAAGWRRSSLWARSTSAPAARGCSAPPGEGVEPAEAPERALDP